MTYRETQQESRERYLATYNAEEATKYDAWISEMTSIDHEACIADLKRCIAFRDGMDVLDAGSGTGALCLALVRIPGLRITALEPCSAMIDRLVSKRELQQVAVVQGFCDHADDESLFELGSFDLIASRQLANGLFDPLAAFQNWFRWLRPRGRVALIDGLYDRDGWSGPFASMVDGLPLSACRTMAMIPYLLERTGFVSDFVGLMPLTNALPSTRTQRFMVAATKPHGSPDTQKTGAR